MTDPSQNPLGQISQLAWVVPDLEAAIAAWARDARVGPWLLVYDERPMLNVTVRGEPAEPVVSLALAYSGDLQIELIQQHNDVPTAYTIGRRGFHHIAHFVDDYDAAAAHFERLGVPALMSGGTGAKFTYFETGPEPGTYTEIVWIDPASPRGALLEFRDSSRGKDPATIERL